MYKTIYLTQYGSKLQVKQRKIIIKLPNGETMKYPVRQVRQIIVLGRTGLSSSAPKKLLHYKIPVHFLTRGGKHLGALLPLEQKNISLRIKQYEFFFNSPELQLKLAKHTIKAKLTNSYRLLTRWYRNRGLPFADFSGIYEAMLRRLHKAQDINSVLGVEGYFAAEYFRRWADIIGKKYKFVTRTKRPPRDPVSALLSFGYTILFQRMYSLIYARNLDPYFGFLHQNKYNTPSLAVDLIEEFRAPIVDSVVMTLLTKYKVHPVEDFDIDAKKGYQIHRKILKNFISLLEAKFNQLYKIPEGQLRYEDIMIKKINSFIKVIKEEQDDMYYFIIR